MSLLRRSVASSAFQALLRTSSAQQSLTPFLSSCLPLSGHSLPDAFSRLFSSSSSSSGGGSSKKGKRPGPGKTTSSSSKTQQPKQQQQQQQQQQLRKQRPAAAPGQWPQPARLVLPARKATAPVLGRVPPSSTAAAAAAASMLQPANQPQQQQGGAALPGGSSSSRTRQQQLAGTIERVPETSSGTRLAHQQQQQHEEQQVSSSVESTDASPSPSAAAAAAAVSLTPALPWEVVQMLPQNSRYSLDRMADADLSLFVSYLRSARYGMPSVFELGVAREQGYRGRAQLLRRETLLRHLMQQLLQVSPGDSSDTSDIFGSSNSSSSGGVSSSGSGSGWEVGDGSSSSSSAGWEVHNGKFLQAVSDEQLQELTNEQLAAAAEAAAAACHAAREATGEEVGECLLDYFVFKRCMQLMLLQRQHRRLVQEHYLAYQQQQQQGDSSEYSSDQPSSSSSSSKVPKVTAEELQEVDIWDAFFDADLADYAQYLRAAADGHPSVFTTMNPNAPSVIQQQQQQGVAQQKGGANAAHADSSDDDEDSSTNVNLTPQQQQQQQERQELLEARQQLANSAAMLELMPPGILNRPLLLLGSSQLLQLSVMAEGRVEDVVEVLQDFYKLKRLGFRAALQELMEVADEQSVVERF